MLTDLYKFKQDLNRQGIFFCFSGPISQNLVSEIGSILEQKMGLEKASRSTVLRVFSMVVEKAQNIIHYSAEKYIDKKTDRDEIELRLGIIAVGYENNHYFVLCGNKIHNKKAGKLKKKLALLQSMNKEELKKYYREQRKKEPDKESKGAGLGFIDMAKKANKPIEFDFKKIDDEMSFFSMKTVI
ncbi:SiaB family protein kinase [Desulfobacterales bacterium HSG16]|nr:SiaB family protein kinase [Desulfobacterales bacterium HSG16]